METNLKTKACALVIIAVIIVGPAADVCCWEPDASGTTVTDTAIEAGQALALRAGVTQSTLVGVAGE